jgi:NADPH:quinone reductase-like Zn-dependent oxidoreductase
MKAIVCERYGPSDTMSLRDIHQPMPKSKEVLVRIHAATVTTGDCEIRRFNIPFLFWIPLRLIMGITRPRPGIFGQEYAGRVETVGSDVQGFKKGDAVFGPTTMRLGAYAEFICLPEFYLTPFNPDRMTFEQAATIPTGGINGLHLIQKANIHPGDKVLINGAGGSIGTYALQFAKLLGAEISCVDKGSKLEMLLALGADKVIDCTKEDFTKNGEQYDVIVDIAGKSSYSRCIKMLTRKGRYVLGNPSVTGMFRAIWTSWVTDKEVFFQLAKYTQSSRIYIRDQIETGRIVPFIDKSFTLERVPEAHRYVDTGLKRGNVTIIVVPTRKV